MRTLAQWELMAPTINQSEIQSRGIEMEHAHPDNLFIDPLCFLSCGAIYEHN